MLAKVAATQSALDCVSELQAWVVEMSEAWKGKLARMPRQPAFGLTDAQRFL